MKIYSIFDDFDYEAAQILVNSGHELTIHPSGVARPDSHKMHELIKNFNCVIIGTSQKISEDMWEDITEPRIIATASIGIDHIVVPASKKELVTIINAPTSNNRSVAEYTIACALMCCKSINEGANLYERGMNNKSLSRKPQDLGGKVMGIIGAGRISEEIIRYAHFFNMEILCWTFHPDNHINFCNLGVKFVDLEELMCNADIISVNLPYTPETDGLISEKLIRMIKKDAIFINISRLSIVKWEALLIKAQKEKNFYVCMDVDVDTELVNKVKNIDNVFVTPHIAGGTIEARKRMFKEVALKIAESYPSKKEKI